MKAAIIFGLLTAGLIAGVAEPVYAGENHPAPPPASPEFERIKKLAGTWEGVSTKPGEEGPIKVEYAVTSAGTAVVEKLFPGTPHEMVSVYHDRSGRLEMTHYCAMGNQPELQLTRASAQIIKLDYVAGTRGINTAKDAHMHALELDFSEPRKLTQRWTSYAEGKSQETTILTFSRTA